MINRTIEFLERYTVRAAGGRTFNKGERLTCNLAAARHFVSRNRAKFVDEEAQKPFTATPSVEPVEAVEPVKRGPGRPPKNAEA